MSPKTFIFCDSTEEALVESRKKIDAFLDKQHNRGNLPTKENIHGILINDGKWPFLDDSLSCIVSHMNFHNTENLNELIAMFSASLKSDGCLLADFVSQGSFEQFSNSMSIAENEREGGVSAHSIDFPTPQKVSAILSKCEFNLTSFNINFNLCYFDDFSCLLDMFKETGEVNSLQIRRKVKSRSTFISCAAIYSQLYSLDELNKSDFPKHKFVKSNLSSGEAKPDLVYATFNVASLIGWKYDKKTHQKPMKRGSSEINLNELVEESLLKDDDVKYGSIIEKDSAKIGKGEDEFDLIDLTEKMKQKIISKKKPKEIIKP